MANIPARIERSWRFDSLKGPKMGDALKELMTEKNLIDTIGWTGSWSFTSKSEYESLAFFDNTAEDKEVNSATGLPNNQRTYNDFKDVLPTWSELSERLAELETLYAEYEGKRARRYPRVEEQLDMLYKDIDAGLLGEDAKTSAFYQAISEVKNSAS